MEQFGNVSSRRWNQLVRVGRELVLQMSRCQFALGDKALEIAPIRRGEDAAPAAEHTVEEVLAWYAEEVGVPASTLAKYRWVASRWPAAKRRDDIPYMIHYVLANISDPKERYAAINDPPLHARSGQYRWTSDAARRRVGWQPHHAPQSVEEKVVAVKKLTADDTVAARVAADLLRRPEVAFQAMGDSKARTSVNQAQFDQVRQQATATSKVVNVPVQRVQHRIEYVDLVGVCTEFVATTSKVVESLRSEAYSDDEREVIRRSVSKVRVAADWIDTAVNGGEATLDEGLASILNGQ